MDMCWGVRLSLAQKEISPCYPLSNLSWSNFETISGSDTVFETDNVWYLIEFFSSDSKHNDSLWHSHNLLGLFGFYF